MEKWDKMREWLRQGFREPRGVLQPACWEHSSSRTAVLFIVRASLPRSSRLEQGNGAPFLKPAKDVSHGVCLPHAFTMAAHLAGMDEGDPCYGNVAKVCFDPQDMLARKEHLWEALFPAPLLPTPHPALRTPASAALTRRML